MLSLCVQLLRKLLGVWENWTGCFVKFLYEKINHTIDKAIFLVTNIGKETCFERLHYSIYFRKSYFFRLTVVNRIAEFSAAEQQSLREI
jgi:hypothetical protein